MEKYAVNANSSIDERWERTIQLLKSKRHERREWVDHGLKQRKRIEANMRAVIEKAREEGCRAPHRPSWLGGCPGQFVPEEFWSKTQFAHYTEHGCAKQAKQTGKSKKGFALYNAARGHAADVFIRDHLNKGSMKWMECHARESSRDQSKEAKKRKKKQA
jgi:hypothetical protein